MNKKIIRFSILAVIALMLTLFSPLPAQTDLQAAVRGDCEIEMGSRVNLFGNCRGSTEVFCRSKGDCEGELEIILN